VLAGDQPYERANRLNAGLKRAVLKGWFSCSSASYRG
jgi:hypothetical protein